MLVQKQQRPKCLILRAGRHMPPDREVREERFHLRAAKQGRMPKALGPLVEMNVRTDPANVTVFGAMSVAFHAQTVADLFEQLHGGFLPCKGTEILFAAGRTQTRRQLRLRGQPAGKALGC